MINLRIRRPNIPSSNEIPVVQETSLIPTEVTTITQTANKLDVKTEEKLLSETKKDMHKEIMEKIIEDLNAAINLFEHPAIDLSLEILVKL
ncbi:hypothetical protein HDU92_005556 [Lobulomyces angularis]|nr:hypothetical protein HDU92_005556 [Lobulomyces angularis]